VQAAAQFKTTLSSLQNGDQLTWRRYEVVAGDTISKLAKRFNSNIRSIQQSNNLKSIRLNVGQTLLIPTELETRNSLAVAPQLTSEIQQGEVSLENPVLISHTLEAGDSLWAIARLYGVSTAQLVEWNGIDLISEVGVGEQVLVARNGYQQPKVSKSNRLTDENSKSGKVKLSVAASAKQESGSNRLQKPIQTFKSHVIKKGENLYRISLKHGIKLQQLLDWNNLKLDSVIVPGQSLRVSK
jgi:membrane-bound lytic murein transglycosylase D